MVEVPDLEEEPKKLTNEEYELNKFKEQRRQDGIKKELAKFRRKDSIFNTPPQMNLFREGTTLFEGKKKKPKKPRGLFSVRGNLLGR